MSRQRIMALVYKDLAELLQRPGALAPPLFLSLFYIVVAFAVIIVTPAWSGEPLDGGEFAVAARRAALQLPGLATLDGVAQVQALLFQQFLLLTVTTPTIASMALAAQAVSNEKKERTLEPLLATPLRTWELLAAKTTTPVIVSCVLYLITLTLYAAGIAAFAEPGVLPVVLNRTVLLLILGVAPLVALLALLLAVILSSRVNDARSAQQVGALIILPITALFVFQLIRGSLIGSGALLIAIVVLLVLNAALLAVGVRIFDREAILTDWK